MPSLAFYQVESMRMKMLSFNEEELLHSTLAPKELKPHNATTLKSAARCVRLPKDVNPKPQAKHHQDGARTTPSGSHDHIGWGDDVPPKPSKSHDRR
jgi:hypothetical protein